MVVLRSGVGLQGEVGPVEGRPVLDNGQSQTGASDGFGVALVHPVEPLKDPALVLRRDTDARVRYRELRAPVGAGDGDSDPAPRTIVLDGVVAQVADHLVQKLAHARDPHRSARHLQGDLPLDSGGGQAAGHLLGQVVQVHLLRLEGAAPFIQLGQAEDVLHQADHALGLAVDVVCEAGDVLRLDQPALDDLRNAGDGGEGGLELMRYIGGELPAQLLPLFPLGDIQDDQHGAGHLAVLNHGVGQQLAAAASQVHPAARPACR